MWERDPQEEWRQVIKKTGKDANERKQNVLHMCEMSKDKLNQQKRPESDITCLMDMAKVTDIFILVIKFKLNLFCILSL